MLSQVDLSNDFVAIGTIYTREGDSVLGYHSLLLICSQQIVYAMHFEQSVVQLTIVSEADFSKYYTHRLTYLCLGDGEIEAFKEFCTRICKISNLTRGYIVSDSFYEVSSGRFVSNSGLPELGTCVGLCINILNGWIFDISQYFEYQDWDLLNINDPAFMRHFNRAKTEYPDITLDDYKKHHRRISPDDFMISGVCKIEDMPIRKVKIDSSKNDYNGMIQSFHTPSLV